jgi:hypothetical protein
LTVRPGFFFRPDACPPTSLLADCRDCPAPLGHKSLNNPSPWPEHEDRPDAASHILRLFIFPSILAMVLFITLPIVSVVVQSLFVQHEAVLITVQNCDPFGCTTQTKVDTEAMAEAARGTAAGPVQRHGQLI